MSTTDINGSMQAQQLVGTEMRIHAPGYRGVVHRLASDDGGRAAAGDPLDELVTAAADADVFVVAQLLVDLQPPPTSPDDGGGRSGPAPEPSLVLPKRDGVSYAVLQTAEDGTTTWVLPEERGDEDVAFKLPPPVRKAASDGGRGPITGAMRCIVRVVGWTLAPLLEAGALKVARHWEEKKRSYALRQVTRDGRFIDPNWAALGGGPLLLLVHGTFSTPDAGFNGWVGKPAFGELLQLYGDRCLAFAHPSLSASPDDNIDWMLQQLPASLQSPVDIVCHSRGGLVARVLSANERLSVRRVCQVGAPNVGTPLASKQHMIDFLDGHTAFLTKLPDGVATILLEGTLCLMKLVAMGAHGLPGLAAMLPDGKYLGELGRRDLRAAQWYTIGADFNPGDGAGAALMQRLADKLVDKVFAKANDLVVPTEGCHTPGPVPQATLKLKGGGVHHTSYFADPNVHVQLRDWLR